MLRAKEWLTQYIDTLSIEELDLKYVICLGEVSYIPSTDDIHTNQ